MAYLGTPIDTRNQFQSLSSKQFNGDGSTTDFTLDIAPGSVNDIEVFVGNVRQDPHSAYTLSGTTLTFTGAPPSGTNNIYVVHQAKAVGTITPGANTVGVTELNLSDGSNGQFIKTDGSGTLSFDSVSSTTINNNADNRIITGSGTANTLEGESGLTFDGTTLLYSKNSSSVLKALEFKNLQADTGAATGISFDFELDNSNSNNPKAQMAVKEDGNDGYAAITFSTSPADNDSTLNERMRINSSGILLVGTSSPYASNNSTIHINVDAISSGAGAIMSECSGTGTVFHQHYRNGNGGTGGISTNGTSTSFVTSSDYRLKENETPIVDGIERLKQLKPYKFNFKTDADTTVDGFFAHEVSDVVPEAITGEKDAVDSEDNPKYQGIDQSKLVPLLTSALQEAITKIETLEAENTDIKARLTALEE